MATSLRLDHTFGSILIGTFVGLVLYGMTVQTAYRYFRLYPTDSLRLKGMIIVLIILDMLQMVEACHTSYYYLVLHYSDLPALATGVWSTRLLVITRGLTIVIAQIFYLRRISILAPMCYRWLVVALVPLILAEIAFSIAAAVETFLLGTFARWERVVWVDVVALATVLVADVILAATLVVIFQRSRTGLKTDSLLDLLVMYTLNTCVLTSFMNGLSLILLAALPSNLMYVGVSIPETYSISVLAVLNSRKSFAELMNKSHGISSLGLSNIPPMPLSNIIGRSRSQLKTEYLSTNPSMCRVPMPIEEGHPVPDENTPGDTKTV